MSAITLARVEDPWTMGAWVVGGGWWAPWVVRGCLVAWRVGVYLDRLEARARVFKRVALHNERTCSIMNLEGTFVLVRCTSSV